MTHGDEQAEPAGSATTGLRYQVPAGQDPAAVLAELHGAGFTVTPDDHRFGDKALVIEGEGGRPPDREAVRRVLAGESKLNFDGDTIQVKDPKFEDE